MASMPTGIKFGDKDLSMHVSTSDLKNGCEPGTRIWHGFPIEANDITVPGLKDVITAAGPNMSHLHNKIDMT